MAISDADGGNDERAVVAARLAGFAAVEQIRRAQLARMTEADAARIADELQQLLPHLDPEPDRISGLVEQQRIFARARR
ncbi:MAG: hypothetical protein ACRDYF_18520 [Acidimicrobiia bacterium]